MSVTSVFTRTGDVTAASGDYTASQVTHAADVTASNTFTNTPQNVGAAYSSGQTQVEYGHLYLAATASDAAPPFIKFYSYCDGDTGTNGWDVGVDATAGRHSQDFYIGRVIDNSTDDCFYINYESGCIGMGAAIPPSDSWAVAIETKTTTMGALVITQSASNTATLIQVQDSGGTPKIWVDDNFYLNAQYGVTIVGNNGGSGSNYWCTNFTTASGNTFSFYKTADSGSANLRLRYVNTSTDVFNVDTSAGVQFFNAVKFEGDVGFYNTTPIGQPATTGTTAGYTAGSSTAVTKDGTFTGGTGSTAYTIGDVVLALKDLGLIAA